MASKKAGRLAGLAALAGLAYMNKDKLFGAKGETKATETKAETKAKDTAADDARAAAKRDADEETMGYTSSGNAAMYEKEPGFGTKTTPAKVARSEKAPSASVAKAPAASTAMPEGAFRGRRSDIVGGGRSGGRGGPEAGEEEAYRTKDAKQAELMSSYKPRRPNTELRDVALTGNGYQKAQYSNKALSEMGAKTRGPTIGNASPVVAQGGDRSTRSDNARPVFAPGGNRSVRNLDYENDEPKEMKRGGKVKKMASGGMTSSASKRADGIATKGKTRGRMC